MQTVSASRNREKGMMHEPSVADQIRRFLLFLAFFLPAVTSLSSRSSFTGRAITGSDSCSQGASLGTILPPLTRIEEEAVCSPAMAAGEGWRALVSGGTGAIGKYLVAELLANDKFVAVTVIGRREISFPSDKQPSGDQLAKLHYKQVGDLDEIASIEPSQLTPSEYEVAFCALGTTRKDAGSAAAFRKIDHDGVVNFGDLAKKAGVQHLQLVSSVGANKNSFFLYPKVKGETEEYYRSLVVKQLSIFRPPLLDRGDKARTVEKLAAFIVSSAKVGDVAKAMVKQAETVLQSHAEGQGTFDWKAMKKLIGL